jgi:hypothetical protein
VSDKQLPFYTQTALLDQYIHAEDPSADPFALEVIIQILQTDSRLSQYFFRQGPNAAWAKILWDHHFFEAPPPPKKTEDGYILPWWDAQEFLISVADQAADIVVKHVEIIEGHPTYIGKAIRALQFIPPEQVGPLVPKIIVWLENAEIAKAIASETFELISKLIEKEYPDIALSLFRVLTAPLPPTDVKEVSGYRLRTEAVSKFRDTWHEEKILPKGLDLFINLYPEQIVTVFEEHLCSALRLEAMAQNRLEVEFSSWWRNAIEETEQDRHKEYKDYLLQTLRDSINRLAEKNSSITKSIILKYLQDKHEILRRLGIHLLQLFPEKHTDLVTQELQKLENLNDVGIHHEFFLLLFKGYLYLTPQEQEALIASICEGPPTDYVQSLAKRAEQNYGEDPIKYTQLFSKKWILDRLWMLRNYLDGQPKNLLDSLANELGEPEHPTFTHWSSQAYIVQDVSPISNQELAQLTPDELVKFIKQWKPEAKYEIGPKQISTKGLANDVATLVISDLSKYSNYLNSIALHQPEFAYALLDRFTKAEQMVVTPWEVIVELGEKLLMDRTVRESMDRRGDADWISVRQAIIRLLEVGFKNENRAILIEHLPRVRDILLILVDDLDPVLEDDHPLEGWLGHRDPATLAVNHVRPSALLALIEYARHRANLLEEVLPHDNPQGAEPERLEAIVRETLSRKLDKFADPSWSVHSVYGHYLRLLCWLDQEWVKVHLDQIFPEDNSAEVTWLYVSAWDSFVVFNNFYRPMFEMLHSKYKRAIFNLSQGLITKTHLEPAKHLAVHLGWEYLSGNYDLHSPAGQQSLIVAFYEQAPSETWADLAWCLWRVCAENDPNELEKFWPRVRALWEWRIQKAAIANHPNNFDQEIEWFARLPLVAPQSETIESLWPLLTGLLPHVTRSKSHDMDWEDIEDYLAREVEQDPARAIKLYRMMYDQITELRWFTNRPEIQKIIEVAAASKEARQEVLALIDSMARIGIHQYRYIYEQLT